MLIISAVACRTNFARNSSRNNQEEEERRREWEANWAKGCCQWSGWL